MSAPIPPLITALLDAWNAHDIEQVLACYSPEYEGQDVGERWPQQGLSGLRASFQRYLRAFPGLAWTPESVVCEGDRIALSWTAQGRHQGPLMNIPPTGREIAVRGVSLLTFEDGKVRRAEHIWDVAGLLRALGLLPDLS